MNRLSFVVLIRLVCYLALFFSFHLLLRRTGETIEDKLGFFFGATSGPAFIRSYAKRVASVASLFFGVL